MNITKPEHDSQGIWIPRAIWLTRGLSLREKALLAELSAHTSDADYHPANPHLIDLLDVAERQVRACLAALRDQGFITIRLNARRERIIRVTGKHILRAKRRPPTPGGKRLRSKPSKRLAKATA